MYTCINFKFTSKIVQYSIFVRPHFIPLEKYCRLMLLLSKCILLIPLAELFLLFLLLQRLGNFEKLNQI